MNALLPRRDPDEAAQYLYAGQPALVARWDVRLAHVDVASGQPRWRVAYETVEKAAAEYANTWADVEVQVAAGDVLDVPARNGIDRIRVVKVLHGTSVTGWDVEAVRLVEGHDGEALHLRLDLHGFRWVTRVVS